jgi:hypothetical protein
VQNLIAIVLCKVWFNVGARRCWHILPSLQISPQCDYCLLAHVKEQLLDKQFESEDNINTACTASLHHLSNDKHRTAVDGLLWRWEKCVECWWLHWVEDMCVNIQEYQ